MADRTVIAAARAGVPVRQRPRFGRMVDEFDLSAEARSLVALARGRGLTTEEAAAALGCTPLEWSQLKRGEITLPSYAGAMARISAAPRGTRHRPSDAVSQLSEQEARALAAHLKAKLDGTL